MENSLTVRWATDKDLSLIANVNQIAINETHDDCIWTHNLRESGINTSALDFVMACYRFAATNWGQVEDFIILEDHKNPVAAVSIYKSPYEDFRPLNLNKIEQVFNFLNWDSQQINNFLIRYEKDWGPNEVSAHMRPIAPIVIETVAVLKPYRGKGFGVHLLSVALEIVKKWEFKSVEGSYVVGNIGAEKAYSKAGFRPYVTYHKDYFSNGYWGCVRLLAQLQEIKTDILNSKYKNFNLSK